MMSYHCCDAVGSQREVTKGAPHELFKSTEFSVAGEQRSQRAGKHERDLALLRWTGHRQPESGPRGSRG